MKYTDYYLKAADEAAMIAALDFARGEDENGNPVWMLSGPGYVLDIIGTVVITPATYDAGGNELTPAVVDTAFHVNIRVFDGFNGLIPENLRVFPAKPYRKFFQKDT